MGIEPISLSHLLQPTAICYVPLAFTIDRHINPLIVFSATSTTIGPLVAGAGIEPATSRL
jgi:hypothetical protein